MQPVVLVVMDGVGLRGDEEGNAFRKADTPNLDRLMENGYAELKASGSAVGLPEGYTGNSEVGHLHLGAGRRIPQRLQRINDAIEDGSIAEKEALVEALERAEKNSAALHFAGIISDGGIHGHLDHLKALLEIKENYNIEKTYIHCFTDGRDVAPKSAEKFLGQVEKWCEQYDSEIATVIGRFYSMDRDKNWERTHKAYRAIAEAEGFTFSDPQEAIRETYSNGDYDYFIQPSVNENYPGMTDDDEVIFYNYRADRERQIEEELVEDADPDDFDEPIHPNFTSMLPYERGVDVPSIFDKKIVENTLGEKIENAGMSQLRVAESQKIPHVTYFFNGQRELEFEHEDRKFIESDKIRAFDEAPEMHADETTSIVIDAIKGEKYDFVLLNYANCDLVGHTGDLDATITAVETVDRNIGKLVEVVENSEYAMLVTADHGNCEDMGTADSPNTSHTLNPVPLISVNTDRKFGDLIELEYSTRSDELGSSPSGEIWEVENIVSDLLEF